MTGPKCKGTARPLHEHGGRGYYAFEPHDVLISATRYYIGRKTIQTYTHAQTLAREWEHIDPRTRAIIKRDIRDAFRRDDYARQRGEEFLPLGMDCDRAGWEMVRKAWRSEAA